MAKPGVREARIAADIAVGFDDAERPERRGKLRVYAGEDDEWWFYLSLEGLQRLQRQIQRILDARLPAAGPAKPPSAKRPRK